MLTREEKFVYDILLKKDINKNTLSNLDIRRVVSILLEHKIFLRYYKKLSELFEGMEKNIIKLQYFLIEEKKQRYNIFFKSLATTLNDNNIEFLIYKGIVLEKIINSDRMYNDIDIVLKKDVDYIKAIKILKKYFNVIDINSNHENNLVLEDYVIINFEGINYSIEFKKKCNDIIINNWDNLIEIDINGVIIKTYSLEVTFLNMVKYIYNFTNHYFYIQNGNRYILQYFDDLKIFLERYYNILNFEKIKIIIDQEKMYYKIKKCFLALEQIYSCDFSNIFPFDFVTLVEDDHSFIDSLPILFKIFRRGKFKDYYINFILPTEILKNSNNIKKENILKIDNEIIKINFFSINESKILSKVIFNNLKVEYAIYLQLYYFDKYGFFVAPFLPIYIYKENNKYIAKRFFHSRTRKVIDLEKLNNSEEFSRETIVINYTKKQIEIEIDLEKLDFNKNCKIGLNCIIYNYQDNIIKSATALNCINKYPLILKLDELSI